MTGDPVASATAIFEAEGLQPHSWSNGPDYIYARHDHPYHKVLVCTAGSITFHLAGDDVTLEPGDRLDVPPHTSHAATVGPNGVTCWEAARD